MMYFLSPTFQWIVPRTSGPMKGSCEIEISHMGKGGRKKVLTTAWPELLSGELKYLTGLSENSFYPEQTLSRLQGITI